MAFDSLSDRLSKTMRNVVGKGTLSDANMEDMLKEVRLALLEADVNYKIVKEFLEEIREKARGEEVLKSVEPGEQLVKIIHDQIIELLGTNEVGINFKDDGMTIIMLVGLQGTGKTTSVAKIAKICQEKLNKKCLLIAADVIRPAAIEQLQTLGREINAEVFTKGVEVSALDTVRAGFDYAKNNGFDTVFIDTAGRLHIDEELMQELEDITIVSHPDDILLTVDAMTGQDIVNVAQAFKDALPLTGLVVTKFDGDSRGGGVLSVKKITNVPVKFVGEGEKLDDMSIFYPERMADRILGMGDVVTLVEKAQEKLDLEESEKMADKMLSGTFTMDDMLKQFEMIQNLGPLGGLMKMLPGMNQMAGMMDDVKAEDAMKHTKAIIQSMTKYEREHPEKIRSTMKKRIASGSGTTVNDVNKLINQFTRMKKAMGQLGSMQKNGSLNEDYLENMLNKSGVDPNLLKKFK